MTARALLFIASASLLAASACKSKPAPSAEPSAKPVASAPAPAASPRPALPALETIPGEEDYELEVARDITSQNLEDELDKLEKELQGQ